MSLHNAPLNKPGVRLTAIKRLLEECLRCACAMSYYRGCVSLKVTDILFGKWPRGTKGRRMQPCDSKGPIGPGVTVECELQVVFFVWSVVECWYWLAARDGSTVMKGCEEIKQSVKERSGSPAGSLCRKECRHRAATRSVWMLRWSKQASKAREGRAA